MPKKNFWSPGYQPPTISFEEFAAKSNWSKEEIEHYKRMFSTAPVLKNMLMENKRGEYRVLRPPDV